MVKQLHSLTHRHMAELNTYSAIKSMLTRTYLSWPLSGLYIELCVHKDRIKANGSFYISDRPL